MRVVSPLSTRMDRQRPRASHPLVGVSRVLSDATSPPYAPNRHPAEDNQRPQRRRQEAHHVRPKHLPHDVAVQQFTGDEASGEESERYGRPHPALQNPLEHERTAYIPQRRTNESHDLDLVAARDAREPDNVRYRQRGGHGQHAHELTFPYGENQVVKRVNARAICLGKVESLNRR